MFSRHEKLRRVAACALARLARTAGPSCGLALSPVAFLHAGDVFAIDLWNAHVHRPGAE
jgi:hypothetical protein